MNSSILRARTVAIVRDFKVEKRQGANGEFESKDILFRIAVDRDYQVSVTENGITGKKRPTDFWLAKCTGEVAERFNKFCTAKDEQGKLVSRHLLLGGNFEQYQKPRKIHATPQVNMNGQLVQLEFDMEVPDTSTIFIVNDIEFLDGKKDTTPANTTPTATIASMTPVGTAPAQAPVQGATTVQTTAPVAQAPVQTAPVAQPVATAPVAQPAQATPVAQAPVADMSNAMNPPVVGAEFTPDGQTAPF